MHKISNKLAILSILGGLVFPALSHAQVASSSFPVSFEVNTSPTHDELIASLKAQIQFLINKLVEILSAQIAAQNSLNQTIQQVSNVQAIQAQQIAQIAGQAVPIINVPVASVPSPVVDTTPRFVSMTELKDSISIFNGDNTYSNYAWGPNTLNLNIISSQNDNVTLKINGQTFQNAMGKIALNDLTPNTGYPYEMDVQRNNLFASTTGIFKTLPFRQVDISGISALPELQPKISDTGNIKIYNIRFNLNLILMANGQTMEKQFNTAEDGDYFVFPISLNADDSYVLRIEKDDVFTIINGTFKN